MVPNNAMVSEIAAIAKDAGLIDSNWIKCLAIKWKPSGRSYGGRKSGGPWMSINYNEGYLSPDELKICVDNIKWLKPGRRKERFKRYVAKASLGYGVWPEYASFCKDSEIGDYFGTDDRAPLAILLCHEIAHAIDFTPGCLVIAGHKYLFPGRGHSSRWKAIYRLLRNAYVKSGKYNNTTGLPLSDNNYMEVA